ncbi:ATP-binding protein [Streptomyces sp. SudanB182_2057]|uniref:ATP-binding protein n=1 Tax=Streptomyces sp. SudanB182_2057 TaxID=3035281 RepID=UPI003F544165
MKNLSPDHEAPQRFDSAGRSAVVSNDGPANETLTLIAAELASNAVRHGHVPRRDFRIRLTASDDSLRLEVSDTRTERLPEVREPSGESGRGLVLVEALADKWGVAPRQPGKTVWAEVWLSPATQR